MKLIVTDVHGAQTFDQATEAGISARVNGGPTVTVKISDGLRLNNLNVLEMDLTPKEARVLAASLSLAMAESGV